jgi:hypothetical protein
MGERKHKAEGGQKKAIQPQREEEHQLEKKPTEALMRLSENVAQPSDVQTLQKTIGNRSVTNMIQKHPQDDMDRFSFWVQEGGTGRPMWRYRGHGDTE